MFGSHYEPPTRKLLDRASLKELSKTNLSITGSCCGMTTSCIRIVYDYTAAHANVSVQLLSSFTDCKLI